MCRLDPRRRCNVARSRSARAAVPGKTVYSEPLAWVSVKGGSAKTSETIPLALSGQGCPWRATALSALDRARRSYRIAYTCENCQGQLAALLADLAIAPLPVSLLAPGYEKLGRREGLPTIGNYQIRLCESPEIGPAGSAFAEHVADSFEEIGRS